jgi:hypothetical protein
VIAHPNPFGTLVIGDRGVPASEDRLGHSTTDCEPLGDDPLESSQSIMVNRRPLVNPHPVPDRDRLAQVHDETLARLIVLHRADLVPAPRRELAGIPPLDLLLIEQTRRERVQREAA